MEYRIITNVDANRDIINSFEYYQKVAGKKVADKFFKDFHRLPLKVFPFIIIYKVEREKQIIRIFRVFHASQNPEKYP